jgi:hypothetical protein
MLSQHISKTGRIFAYAGVVQDKQPQVRLTAGTSQPATASTAAVGSKGGSATATTPAVDRVPHGSEKRQTEQVTGRVPHHIKTGMLQVMAQNGWKESKFVRTACEAYLEHDLGEKFGVRLAAQVTEAVNAALDKFSNRIASLWVHDYYASEENRIISTKVYGYLFGTETEIYKQTVRDARQDALRNLKQKIAEKYPPDTYANGNRQSQLHTS